MGCVCGAHDSNIEKESATDARPHTTHTTQLEEAAAKEAGAEGEAAEEGEAAAAE